MIAITLGTGRRSVQGRRVAVAGVLAFIAALTSRAPTAEFWWSPHCWRGNRRRREQWESSCGVALDLDYRDAKGAHVAPPPDVASRMERLARGGLTGAAWHATPRGARLVYLFNAPVVQPDPYERICLGAAARAEAELRAAGLLRLAGGGGYEVDRAVLVDRGRLLFAPRAKCEHESAPRDAEVLAIGDSFDPAFLAAVPQEPQVELPRSQQAETTDDFDEAVRHYNAAHRRELPRSGGDCPMCGHRECFGQLPETPERWACFSASHTQPGVKGNGCYHGDALDLEAHAAGCSRLELLRREGYLSSNGTAAAREFGQKGYGQQRTTCSEGNGAAEPSRAAVRQWPDPPKVEAFHGLAGEFARMVEPHTEADPAALLTQFMVGACNMFGRGAHTVAEADRHYDNLFLCLVGATAKGRKGTSWGHVRNRLAACDSEWADNRVQGGLASGEGLIWAVRDPISKREPVYEGKGTERRIIRYDDVEVDAGVTDRRLLVFEPEFALVLRVLARDGNTLSAIIRQAWDTGTLRTLTKSSPARASDAHISIISHVTRPELGRYLDATESANGFANRFLWCCTKRARCLPDGGAIASVDFGAFDEELRRVVAAARKLGDKPLHRDLSARDLWHSIYPDLSEGKPGLLGAVTSRAEAQVMRLSLLYALLDGAQTITELHLQAALELWVYCYNSAQYVFGDALGDPVADELLAELRRRPKGMTRTEIRDFFGRNRPAASIDRALTTLAENGLAVAKKVETDGRSATLWCAIVPERTAYDRNDRNDQRWHEQVDPDPYVVSVVGPEEKGVSFGGDEAAYRGQL